jgi:Na+-driven multidrug efflux pump
MIPFLFLTITVLKLDILWIMFAYIAADISEAAVLWFYFAKGTWKLRRVG